MAREDPHFRLRIPEDLKAQIEKAAGESQRSITAEVVARLRSSFDRDQGAILEMLRHQNRLISAIAEFQEVPLPEDE